MNFRSTRIHVLLFFLFAFHIVRAQDGSLDPGFGTNGMVFNPAAPYRQQEPTPRVLGLPDGRVLHLSTTQAGAQIVRYLSNGDLDPSFGTGGVLRPLAGPMSVSQARLLPDGKILVADGNALWRLNADGSPDTGFDGDGRAAFTIGVSDFVLVGNGKIVGSGGGTQRILEDGTLDPTFTNPGIGSFSIAVQADGKILLAHQVTNPWTNGPFSGATPDLAVRRLLPNGQPDLAFGTNGMATYVSSTVIESVRNVLVRPDGQIFVTGHGSLTNDNDYYLFTIARFHPDGSSNGYFTTRINGGVIATDAALLSDGRVLVAGYNIPLMFSPTPGSGGLVLLGLSGNIYYNYIQDFGPFAPYSIEYGNGIGFSGNNVLLGAYASTSMDPATRKSLVMRLLNNTPPQPRDLTTFYLDTDQDGWGQAGQSQTSFYQPPGYAARSGDCNNQDPQVNPGATEVADGIDNNCNGQIDEGFMSFRPIPARIQAEDWTRMSGVQTETTTDNGSGLNVGYIDNGDWMEYAIHAPAAGEYTLHLRLATPSTSQPRLEVRTGNEVLTTLDVPNTGGFQHWETVSIPVRLPAGNQVIRITSTGYGYWNINWLEFEEPLMTYTPVPARIEAEQWSTMSGVQVEPTADEGGGVNVGYIDNGDWMDYRIRVQTTGMHRISLRLATPSVSMPQLQLLTNGQLLTTLDVPNTGGFQNWQTVSVDVPLQAGNQTLRIRNSGYGYWNINWLIIHLVPANNMVAASAPERASELSVFPNPTRSDVQVTIDRPETGPVQFELVSADGRLVRSFSYQKPEGRFTALLALGELPPGFYIMRVHCGGQTWTRKIIRQ